MGRRVLKKIIEAYLTKFAEPKLKKLTGEDIILTIDNVTENRYKEIVVFVNTDQTVKNRNLVHDVIKNYVYQALNFLGEDSMSARVIINNENGVWFEEEVPYQETINEKNRVRVFTESVEDGELKWHRDREDRIVKVIESNRWFLQIDNELPVELIVGESYFIPKGEYHRVIKGNGDLKVSINFI